MCLLINHLKKVFDNYRLKVRDFEDKKAVIIYDSHNTYPEDCVKFDWQNDEYIIYEVHRSRQIIIAKDTDEKTAIIKLYIFCLRFFAIKILTPSSVEFLTKSQEKIQKFYNADDMNKIKDFIINAFGDMDISFAENNLEGISLVKNNNIYFINVNGYPLYKSNNLCQAYSLTFNVCLKISILCKMIREKFGLNNCPLSLMNIYLFGTQFSENIPRPL